MVWPGGLQAGAGLPLPPRRDPAGLTDAGEPEGGDSSGRGRRCQGPVLWTGTQEPWTPAQIPSPLLPSLGLSFPHCIGAWGGVGGLSGDSDFPALTFCNSGMVVGREG